MSRDGTLVMKGQRRRGLIAAPMFAWVIALAVLATAPMLALAAMSTNRIALQDNPRLAKLQVEIWPEFDRPAALVLLRGELAAETKLPATVSLRLPASSDGPAAVAFANTENGELFNLQHEAKPGPEFITVRFEAPQRYFHLEFYDAIATDTPQRHYTYTWLGDLPAAAVTVRIQEPAQATDLSVQPALGTVVTGANNLIYRTADVGSVPAGKPLTVQVNYTKADARTSSEILGMTAPKPTAQSAAPPIEGSSVWLMGVAVALLVTTVAGTVLFWWYRRSKALVAPRTGAGFCTQCGGALRARDRFCSKCGGDAMRETEQP